jgi:hypothetical protein
VRAVRRLVPRAVRHAVSARIAHLRGWEIDRQLAALASGDGPIVVGPWLGEVGFELLYWVPFVAWFAEHFTVDRRRLFVIARGGTAAWYASFADHYHDVLDYVSPEAFREYHEARVREIGEQKQSRITEFERKLVAEMLADMRCGGAARLLHPSAMYRLFAPFWWGHVGESWVHRRARYRRHHAVDRSDLPHLPPSYCAVKFYFNACFPDTVANRAFVRDVVAQLARTGPVVSLSAETMLDDHRACGVAGPGVIELSGVTPAASNLQVQSTVVAHARAFVGTYGGFAYLAPFYGVPAKVYFSDASGFASSHLRMAYSAFATVGVADLLEVHPVSAGHGPVRTGSAL